MKPQEPRPYTFMKPQEPRPYTLALCIRSYFYETTGTETILNKNTI